MLSKRLVKDVLKCLLLSKYFSFGLAFHSNEYV